MFDWCRVGEWYLVVTCPACGVRFPALPDGSAENSSVPYYIPCPNCHTFTDYYYEEFERYQHQVSRN